MTQSKITPALNQEIVNRVQASFKGFTNVTKKQFDAAFKAEVKKAGYSFKYYNSVMRTFGFEY